METKDDIQYLDKFIEEHEEVLNALSSENSIRELEIEIAFFKELRDIKIKERNPKKVSTAVYIENNKGDINIF